MNGSGNLPGILELPNEILDRILCCVLEEDDELDFGEFSEDKSESSQTRYQWDGDSDDEPGGTPISNSTELELSLVCQRFRQVLIPRMFRSVALGRPAASRSQVRTGDRMLSEMKEFLSCLEANERIKVPAIAPNIRVLELPVVSDEEINKSIVNWNSLMTLRMAALESIPGHLREGLLRMDTLEELHIAVVPALLSNVLLFSSLQCLRRLDVHIVGQAETEISSELADNALERESGEYMETSNDFSAVRSLSISGSCENYWLMVAFSSIILKRGFNNLETFGIASPYVQHNKKPEYSPSEDEITLFNEGFCDTLLQLSHKKHLSTIQTELSMLYLISESADLHMEITTVELLQLLSYRYGALNIDTSQNRHRICRFLNLLPNLLGISLVCSSKMMPDPSPSEVVYSSTFKSQIDEFYGLFRTGNLYLPKLQVLVSEEGWSEDDDQHYQRRNIYLPDMEVMLPYNDSRYHRYSLFETASVLMTGEKYLSQLYRRPRMVKVNVVWGTARPKYAIEGAKLYKIEGFRYSNGRSMDYRELWTFIDTAADLLVLAEAGKHCCRYTTVV